MKLRRGTYVVALSKNLSDAYVLCMIQSQYSTGLSIPLTFNRTVETKVTMVALLDYFVQRQNAILQLIRELVEQESTSREAARLDQIARFTAERLQPFATEIHLLPHPGYGTHLLARFAFGHSATAPPIVIIGHLDTVWPVGTLQRLPYKLDEDGKLRGPGVFDMKASVACLIEALRFLITQSSATKRPLTVLLTCDEEIGSVTSRPLIEEEAKRAAVALVLEPPIPGGIVKTGRKGVGVFTLSAQGRAAHAGHCDRKDSNGRI